MDELGERIADEHWAARKRREAEAASRSRRLEFLEALANGADLQVNGVPWREMFDRTELLREAEVSGADRLMT